MPLCLVNGYTFLKNWLFLSGSGLPFLKTMKWRQLISCEIHKIDAFQELQIKGRWTKGSKKAKKSIISCL